MTEKLEAYKAQNRGYRCGRCGVPVNFVEDDTQTICPSCGIVALKPGGPLLEGVSWLDCLMPIRREWDMTAGVEGDDIPWKSEGQIDYDALVSLPMSADVEYIDAYGQPMSRAKWIEIRGVDPAVELRKMRQRMYRPPRILKVGR